MTSSDFIAGHPIAIRVGGRRLSQSHPTRASPTKANTHGSPSTSPEDQHVNEPQPTPDYPRPTSHPTTTSPTEGGDQQGSPNGNDDGTNRKERRRRQEKKKDKYQTEEEKMHGLPRGYPDVRMASKEGKMMNGGDKGRRNSASTAGIRITQPASKFMV